jgi:hypothetical protein
MMLHWRSYKEKIIAEKWKKQWAKTLHAIVEFDLTSLLFHGGIPAHKNHIEGSKREDKACLNWQKHKLVPLATAQKETFCITTGLIQMCTADRFYNMSMSDGNNALASPFNVSFPFTSQRLGYCNNTIVIPSILLLSGKKKPKETYCHTCQTGYYQVSSTQFIQESIKRCPKQSWQCCHSW